MRKKMANARTLSRAETSGMHGNFMRENRESLQLSFADGTEERAWKGKIRKSSTRGLRNIH